MSVRANNLVETVYEGLKHRLQFSEINLDDRLVDTEIAEQYGVSRMPAREALLRLVAEGYLIGTTRGFAVKPLSLDDIREIFEVRRQLEPRAAACAARDMSPEAAAALTVTMEQIREGLRSENLALLLSANVEFRKIWVSVIANRHLASTISRFIDYFQSVRVDTFRDPAARTAYIESLEGIYDAFITRDSPSAQDRMTDYMLAAEKAFLAIRARQIAREDLSAGRVRQKRK